MSYIESDIIVLRNTTFNVANVFGVPVSLSGTDSSSQPIRGVTALNGIYGFLPVFFPADLAPALLPDFTTDPPFPPVWPYLFSTDVIYGRDHLSVSIKFIRQDTFTFDATVILDGNPVDITGWSLVMTAKWDIRDADSAAVFQRTIGSGIAVTSAVNGEFTVTIASSNTSSLPLHRTVLPFDIQATDTSGNKYTILYGNLVVDPDVTSVTP
jgi:hypothetical protein